MTRGEAPSTSAMSVDPTMTSMIGYCSGLAITGLSSSGSTPRRALPSRRNATSGTTSEATRGSSTTSDTQAILPERPGSALSARPSASRQAGDGMSFKFKVTGLREVESQLKRLQSKARSLGGTHSVPIKNILTDGFIRQHTRYTSADEWFTQSPFANQSQEDFEAIPDAERDTYVRTTTTFSSWQDMLENATRQYVQSRLLGSRSSTGPEGERR